MWQPPAENIHILEYTCYRMSHTKCSVIFEPSLLIEFIKLTSVNIFLCFLNAPLPLILDLRIIPVFSSQNFIIHDSFIHLYSLQTYYIAKWQIFFSIAVITSIYERVRAYWTGATKCWKSCHADEQHMQHNIFYGHCKCVNSNKMVTNAANEMLEMLTSNECTLHMTANI